MDKAPEERFDQIKREIIQISESYVLVRQNMDKEDPTAYEKRHFQFLQMRLNDLTKELNQMSAKGEISIPLLYKDAVNKLRRSLLESCPKEFKQVAKDIDYLNVYLM